MVSTPTPFHQHAEEIGRFLFEDRALDNERHHEDSIDWPSENAD